MIVRSVLSVSCLSHGAPLVLTYTLASRSDIPVQIHWKCTRFLPLFQGRWPSFNNTESLPFRFSRLSAGLSYWIVLGCYIRCVQTYCCHAFCSSNFVALFDGHKTNEPTLQLPMCTRLLYMRMWLPINWFVSKGTHRDRRTCTHIAHTHTHTHIQWSDPPITVKWQIRTPDKHAHKPQGTIHEFSRH